MIPYSDLPNPRVGLLGLWDHLIGPGASLAENTLILVGSVLGGVLAVLFLVPHNSSTALLIVGGLLGLDLIGGAVANATNTTKQWYHRPSVGVRQHFAFISLHLTHIAILAWFFRGGDVQFFVLFGLTLLTATGVVLAVPTHLKRPVAAGLYLGAILLGLYAVTPTVGFEWFVPALFLKLLVGHLVPEWPRNITD